VKFRYYYMLGLTLIIIVLLLPAGLVGLARRPTPRR
jgi:ABC-type branched-subunit amino acid transport system permease subunit